MPPSSIKIDTTAARTVRRGSRDSVMGLPTTVTLSSRHPVSCFDVSVTGCRSSFCCFQPSSSGLFLHWAWRLFVHRSSPVSVCLQSQVALHVLSLCLQVSRGGVWTRSGTEPGSVPIAVLSSYHLVSSFSTTLRLWGSLPMPWSSKNKARRPLLNVSKIN